jgi:Flp pilus assembly protein CpaB
VHVAVANADVARVGATVDVIASYSNGADERPPTVVVAAGALVLSTDTARARGTGRDGAGVTLLVDAGEAIELADAQANGIITIALVPPDEARAGS